MSEPLADKPFRLLGVREGSENLPNFQDLGLEDDRCLKRQSGGRKEGLMVLSSFLEGRGQLYSRRMSSPVTAYGHCSRISPYLAFGVLSLREVLKRLEGRERELLRESPNEVRNWSHSLKAFSKRLRWH